MSIINWAKLKAEGRAKDIGISWSEEELKAVYTEKIPADYVRKGILTVEQYTEALELEEKSGKSLETEDIEVIKAKAKDLNINATPDADKDSLIRNIKVKEAKKDEDAKATKNAKADANKTKK